MLPHRPDTASRRAPDATRRGLVLLAVVGFGVGAAGTLGGLGLVRAETDPSRHEFFLSEARRMVPFLPPKAELGARFAPVAAAPAPFAPVARPSRPARFAALTPVRGPAAEDKPARATPVLADLPAAGRTVCVRTCDGYAFPLGNLSSRADLPAHEAGCAAACPGAPTALYTLPPGARDLHRAVSLAGQPYDRLPTAGLHQRRWVEACTCGAPAAAAMSHPMTPLLRDGTLRAGDVIARVEGAAAILAARAADGSGRPQAAEFREPGALPASVRRDVDRLTGTSRREAARAAFGRVMRERHAAALAAEREAPRVRVAAATDGFAVLAAGSGFSAVRVVVPSPYRAGL